MFVGVAQQTPAQTRAALEATLAAVSGHRVKTERGGSTKRRA